MPKVKQQTAKKIGLFSAIMVIFGAVVGIGIFFKNYAVFRNNQGNPIGVLLSWIIAIIMVLCIALSYCEISTCKLKNKADGLGGWAERFCGHSFGRFSKLGYSLIFYAVDTFAIMFFAGEACMNCFAQIGSDGSAPGGFNFGSLTTLYVFLAGGGLFALFIILNAIASKGMTKFSNVTGIIKFVPIAAVIILGIVFGCLGQHVGGIWNGSWYNGGWTQASQNISVTGMIASLPAILFAFEGYLVIGNIAGDMENPEKNVPLAVILAMVIISVIYLAITIGCMTIGTGNVYQLMTIICEKCGLGAGAATALSTIMSVFIFICIIGVLNAMVLGGMRSFQANCQEGIIFKSRALLNKKPNSPYFAGGVCFSVAVGLWFIATIIPSVILNNDQIVDGSSVVMIIFVYVLYGAIILMAFVNRFTKKVEVKKMKIFPVTAVIGILVCLFMIGFCAFWQFLGQPISEVGNKMITMPDGSSHVATWNDAYACGWGLFVNVKESPIGPAIALNYWQVMVCFWVMFAAMFAIPFANDAMIKFWDKANKEPLIWQKAKVNLAPKLA